MSIILHDLIGKDPSRPFSPHCWKIVMALAHKGLAFERNGVRFTQIPDIEGGVSKTVPIIRDGSRVVADSFLIADYLEETYPDRPSLFGGEGGQALARFVESWTNVELNRGALIGIVVLDVHNGLDEADQAYFRKTREARIGMTLEQAVANREAAIEAFSAKLAPLRQTLSSQPFIGGSTPLFADYILFGSLQFARLVSPAKILRADDPVHDWFERCLDLYDGLGRSAPAMV